MNQIEEEPTDDPCPMRDSKLLESPTVLLVQPRFKENPHNQVIAWVLAKPPAPVGPGLPLELPSAVAEPGTFCRGGQAKCNKILKGFFLKKKNLNERPQTSNLCHKN